ncbi:hypothetical protein ABZV77_05875 [Streptomyces sp. NPDC004732]|uniref:hypothetical protein n=1 Tax=Streptomyces sp. NPDC004732 TaxID=3154290 RepID=UPI0033AB90E3
MPDQQPTVGERELAYCAHLQVATRTPFVDDHPGRDPDPRIAEAVYDSLAVHTALHRLTAAIAPGSALVPVLLPALHAARQLLSLRSSWTDYCNGRFGLDPNATDRNTEMSRQYAEPAVVRAWPKYAEAKEACAAATNAVRELQPALALVAGLDSASADAVAPGGLRRSGLRLVPCGGSTR